MVPRVATPPGGHTAGTCGMELLYPIIGAILGFGFLLYWGLRDHWSGYTRTERRTSRWILTVVTTLFILALLFAP